MQKKYDEKGYTIKDKSLIIHLILNDVYGKRQKCLPKE